MTSETKRTSRMLKRFLAVAALGVLTVGLGAMPASSAAGPAAAAYGATSPAPAAHATARAIPKPGTERYLHVKVEDSENGESVNVNLPLSMAEKIIPAVNRGDLHNGRVKIHDADIDGVDIRAMLDALRTAEDNEFVTVKQKDQEVRVAKSKGNLVIHIVDNSERDKDAEKDADRESGKDNKDAKKSYKMKIHSQKVEVTVPMKVVDALISTTKDNELDIAAALRALGDAGDAVLVTVQDASQHIRVWVDSRSGQE
jgi:hypothetical protein